MALRFQCTFCFTIIRHDVESGGSVTCPSCNKRVAVPRSRFEAGCVIDDFVIDSLIAHGGMASVYLARQLSMDRMVALKILKSKYREQQTFVDSFLKEAKSAARLNHPNIIQALAVGVDNEALFYAMEYVKGETLAARIDREKSLDEHAALNIIQQCAEALHAAWTQEGLIHRDMKPDNVMLADDGYAKIMDLGIAVSKYDADKAEISGTPTFMAPEQFRRGKLDCRTDIYAVGCTLYNCVTGFPPFDGDTVEEIAQQQLYTELTFPDTDLVPMSPRMRKIITRMLEKSPDDRFQDYDELLEDVVNMRRRIAPDDSLVPSVHTISFSKYRLREELSESPSEVYRKRTDKKRKVEQAKQQKKITPAPIVSPRSESRAVPVLVGVMAVLLVIIGVLMYVVVQRQNPNNNRTFAGSARDFIETHRQHVAPEFVNTAALETELAIGTDLAESLPDEPNRDEVSAFVELQRHLTQMSHRLALIQSEKARIALADLEKERAKIRQERTTLEEERKLLADTQADLTRQTEQLTQRQAQFIMERTEMETMKTKVTAELEAAEALKTATLNPIRYQLQTSIFELLRAGRYDQVQALVAPVEGEPQEMAEWRARKATELANAMSVIAAVGESNLALNGKRLGEARIQAVVNYVVRYNTAESPDTIRERHVRDLSVNQLIELAHELPEPPIMAPPVTMHLALSYGDLKLANTLAETPQARQYLDDIAHGTYQVYVDEIVALQGIAQRTLAKAKIFAAKQRYEQLPGFEHAEAELSELLRGGSRQPVDPTPEAETP